ncbi:MAG: hypothetical protein KDD61_12435 [Bdellovibrionales bacterium]|nr:hypothetical protein [Bdellovibrionales bacterium]
MPFRKSRIKVLVVLFVCLGANSALSKILKRVKITKTDRQSEIRAFIEIPENSKAVVFLFPGGPGNLKFSGKGELKSYTTNFTVISRKWFHELGYTTVLFSVPIDIYDPYSEYRYSKKHADDIVLFLKRVQAKGAQDIFLVGHSQGTKSVLNLLANHNEFTAGVLYGTLLDSRSQKILENSRLKEKVIFIHHERDECVVTSYKSLLRWRKHSKPIREIPLYTVKSATASPLGGCQALSDHSFVGKEKEAIDLVEPFFQKWLSRPQLRKAKKVAQ